MPLTGEAGAPPTYLNHQLVASRPGRLVYRADHDVFKGPCMQKTVPLVGMPDAMMLAEPQLIEKLDHPHIVKIREAQHDPGTAGAVTYVMPYYPGGSVDEFLNGGGQFSVLQALGLSAHLLDALAYLHVDHGFVHRDVKPGNLLLDASRSNGFLSDFGSAARLGSSHTVAARGFTLPYLDPAAYMSALMTVSSDVYGVGITLFEMLSGLLISKFDPPKAFARLGKGLRPYTPTDMTFAPHVPSIVRRLVNKATTADPTKRYSTAAEMATAVAKAERSVIDWVRVSGAGLDGEWQGTWPPAKPVAQRRSYQVYSSVVAGGKHAGKRLVEAYCDTGTGWRRFGGLSEHIASSDHKAVSKFFDKVDEFVAQNRAAR